MFSSKRYFLHDGSEDALVVGVHVGEFGERPRKRNRKRVGAVRVRQLGDQFFEFGNLHQMLERALGQRLDALRLTQRQHGLQRLRM